MLMGDSSVLGPTPMQSFKGANFAGVPQPKLMNDSKSANYEAEASGSSPVEHRNILLTAAAFVAVAYVAWHVLYER